MPNIRISAETHERLINLKRGADTLDKVIRLLLAVYDAELLQEEVKAHDRQALESKRTRGGKGVGGNKIFKVRGQKP